MLNGKPVYTIIQTPTGEFVEYTGFAEINGMYTIDPAPQNWVTHIPIDVAKNSGLLQRAVLVSNNFQPQANQLTTVEKQIQSIQSIQSIQQTMYPNNGVIQNAHVTGAKGALDTYRPEVPASSVNQMTFTLNIKNPPGNGNKRVPIGGTTKLISKLFNLTAADVAGLEFSGTYDDQTYTTLQDYIVQSGACRVVYWQEQAFNATTGEVVSDVYGANSLETGQAFLGQLTGVLYPIVYPKSPSDFQTSIKNLGADVITKLITANSFLLRRIKENRELQIVVTLESLAAVQGMVLASQLG